MEGPTMETCDSSDPYELTARTPELDDRYVRMIADAVAQTTKGELARIEQETLPSVWQHNERELEQAREGLPLTLLKEFEESRRACSRIRSEFPLEKGIIGSPEYERAQELLSRYSALKCLGKMLYRHPEARDFENVQALSSSSSTSAFTEVLNSLREHFDY